MRCNIWNFQKILAFRKTPCYNTVTEKEKQSRKQQRKRCFPILKKQQLARKEEWEENAQAKKEGGSARNDSEWTNIIPVADVETPEVRIAQAMRRPARKRQSGNFTEPDEQKTQRRSEDRKRIAKESQGIVSHRHQRSEDESFGAGSVSAEGLVLLFFLCFWKIFGGTKWQNQIAIPVGSIYNRESKKANNRSDGIMRKEIDHETENQKQNDTWNYFCYSGAGVPPRILYGDVPRGRPYD